MSLSEVVWREENGKRVGGEEKRLYAGGCGMGAPGHVQSGDQ
jgi:hypothetical protein